MIVLSASQLVVVAAVVAVSVVVLWPAVDVAVLRLVVAVVLSVQSVLISLVVGGSCPVTYCCLGGGPGVCLGSRSSAPILLGWGYHANLFFRTLDRCCSV